MILQKQIFKLIATEIQAITNPLPIKHIDLFYGQIDDQDMNEVYQRPAVFLDIQIKLDNNRRTKEGTATITAHLCVDSLYLTQFNNSEEFTNATLIYSLNQSVIDAIQKAKDKNIFPPKLTEVNSYKTDNTLAVITTTYDCPISNF